MVLRLIQALRGFPQLWEDRHSGNFTCTINIEIWVLIMEHKNDSTRSFGCCLAAFHVWGIWNLMKLSIMTFRVNNWFMIIDLSFPSLLSSHDSQRHAVLLWTSLLLSRCWDYIFKVGYFHLRGFHSPALASGRTPDGLYCITPRDSRWTPTYHFYRR